MKYQDFIKSKKAEIVPSGFKPKDGYFNSHLFDYQRDILERSLSQGRYALFMDTGLGKSITQMNWAEAITIETNKNVLMLAPLAVVYQMLKEADKFGFEINHIKSMSDFKKGVNITNYENIGKVDVSKFDGAVLDESSILKNADGKTTRLLIQLFRNTKYKLLCTATPSPNDFVEIGNHSEFLNHYTMSEMKAIYFTQDRMNTAEFVLKGHAEDEFWEWVAGWADAISSPADLGYDGSKHILPALNEIYHEISHDDAEYLTGDSLFSFAETNATTLNKNKKKTIDDRVAKLAEIVGDESHLVWCNTNDEADKIKAAIPDMYEVRGSDKDEKKAELLNAFADGEIKKLVTKPSIAGMGLNFQGSHNMTFIGLDYSYERYYQSVRRMYRFGQKEEVNVNIIIADNEKPILNAINRKKAQHETMKKHMLNAIIKHKVKKGLSIDVFTDYTFPKFLKSKGE